MSDRRWESIVNDKEYGQELREINYKTSLEKLIAEINRKKKKQLR